MIETYFVGIILGLIILLMITSVMYLASKDLENYWLELDEKFSKK